MLLRALFYLGVFGSSMAAQSSTDQQLSEILKELREIHKVLAQQQSDAPTKLGLPAKDGQPAQLKLGTAEQVLGSQDAPLTLVEFSDYQCSYCQRFHFAAFQQFEQTFIKTGRVRFVSRDLPLPMHVDSLFAAEESQCAAEHGKYWKLRDILFSSPDRLRDISVLANKAGLPETFGTCVNNRVYKDRVEGSVMDAERLGIAMTPSFILGKTTKDGVDGNIYLGALSFKELEQKLELLEKNNVKR